MKTIISRFIAANFLCFMIPKTSAQLTFISGVDPSAASNGNYAAAQFSNFSNSGGNGEFSSGTGNNLFGTDPQTWSQQIYNISFSYAPTRTESLVYVSQSGVGTIITTPLIAPNELQILVGNTGPGDLILTLTSINSVLYGGTLNGPNPPYVFGGTPQTFAPGTTFSAANGTTLQAYLNNPTLFSSAFTLNGTITLDAPANSTYYGDNLNSLIELNLTSVPEPSSWALMVSGASLLVLCRKLRKK